MVASTETNIELLVRQDDPRQFRFVEAPAPEAATLDDGEVLVRVEKFGFSANNVTYAVLGKSDIINYFDFFPTGDAGWGKVPVWGMGVIAASRHPEHTPGERMYGYFPLARYARLRPARTTALGFDVDRGSLPAVYNQYTLTRSDPFYVPAHEDAMIVFRPLVFTSILLDDFIADGNGYFDAESVTIASASSKTSFGLAFMLARRHGDRAIIGLTSARHAPFVKQLGVYSRVVTYEEIDTLPAEVTTAFVDVAGDAGVRRALRARLGSNLRTTITVGLSHWDKAVGPAAGDAASGEPTIFFFAPAWVEKRREDWGAMVLGQKIAGAWQEFMGRAEEWVHVVRAEGADAVASVYTCMVDGRCGPDDAHVLSLWEAAVSSPT
jgi:NADPH:quinone reductase-like Zn-dependent oxidoreductase